MTKPEVVCWRARGKQLEGDIGPDHVKIRISTTITCRIARNKSARPLPEWENTYFLEVAYESRRRYLSNPQARRSRISELLSHQRADRSGRHGRHPPDHLPS